MLCLYLYFVLKVKLYLYLYSLNFLRTKIDVIKVQIPTLNHFNVVGSITVNKLYLYKHIHILVIKKFKYFILYN